MPFANVLKVFLPMQGYHRHIIFIQIQETTFAVNHRLFFYFLPICKNPLKTNIYLIGHRDFPCTACSFRILNHILHISFSLQLMIDVDFFVLHINIIQRQSYKFKKSPFLFSCDCFSCHAVIHDNCGKLKLKRILAYKIIIDSHLKSRSDNFTLSIRFFPKSSFLIMFTTKL